MNYDSTGQDVEFTAVGTTAAGSISNLNTHGAGYMRIDYITNSSATANYTNLSVWYGLKVGVP